MIDLAKSTVNTDWLHLRSTKIEKKFHVEGKNLVKFNPNHYPAGSPMGG